MFATIMRKRRQGAAALAAAAGGKRTVGAFGVRGRMNGIAGLAAMLFGALLIAVGFNLFLLPAQIAAGGVTGISVIVHAWFAVPPAYVQWGLNIPLFLAGLFLLGPRFGMRTAVGSAALPLLVLLTDHMKPLTGNPMLAAVFGGLGVGLGLGIVFRSGGSTGGLDAAAQIVHRYLGVRLGHAIAALDGLVIAAAAILLSAESALYALVGLFVTSRTIDAVQTGFHTSKAAFIISREPDRLSEAILREMDRGLTRLQGTGGYTGQPRPVLLTVVGQNEIARLKALVRRTDANAFVIISNAGEVLGEGFGNDGMGNDGMGNGAVGSGRKREPEKQSRFGWLTGRKARERRE